MVDLPQEKSLTQKFLRYLPWFAVSWALYTLYFYLNQNLILESMRNGGFYKSSLLRFMVRELAVYSIAYINYLHFKKALKSTYTVQFWVFLATLDLVCLLLGLFRQFTLDLQIFQSVYNNIIGLIASPIYSVIFFLYANYFSDQQK